MTTFPFSIHPSKVIYCSTSLTFKSQLLPEFNNFIDVLNCQWSMQMKQLIQQAILLKTKLTDDDYLYGNENVNLLESQMDMLLQTELDNNHKKIRAFIKRLNKNRNSIFTFLHHPKVPPDNNGSERSIRTAKVKMKVSNQFKSLDGAQGFAVLHSVIDTTIKNSQNVLDAHTALANLAAE